MTMYVLGWCMLVYGVAELISAFKIYQVKKRLAESQQPAELQYEEIDEQTPADPSEPDDQIAIRP